MEPEGVCDGGEGAAPQAFAGEAFAHSGSGSFFFGCLVCFVDSGCKLRPQQTHSLEPDATSKSRPPLPQTGLPAASAGNDSASMRSDRERDVQSVTAGEQAGRTESRCLFVRPCRARSLMIRTNIVIAECFVVKVVTALKETGVHAFSPLVYGEILLFSCAASAEERVGISTSLKTVNRSTCATVGSLLAREGSVKAEEA